MTDFWTIHGGWFIFFMILFPRLTMLFTGICGMAFAGPLFWVGWVLLPRFVVAILATSIYWNTNPCLCIFTWIWACGGTTVTTSTVANKRRRN